MHWEKVFCGEFRQIFSYGGQKKCLLVMLGRSYIGMVVWELALPDSMLVLNKWLSYRGGWLYEQI